MIERLKNEALIVGEVGKILAALAVLFGLPIDPATASVIAGAVYTVGTFIVRFVVNRKHANDVETALYTPVPESK